MGLGFRKSGLFYLGTLLSSIGSFAFSGALIPFLVHSGIGLATIGMILGGSRLLGAIFASVLAPKLEEFSPKKVTVYCEIIAAAASAGIMLVVFSRQLSILAFSVCFLIRILAVSAQASLKSKIAKSLAGENLEQSKSHAAMLNNVTQGATFFAGLATWFVIDKVNFGWIILFDALSFLIAGIMLLAIDVDESPAKKITQTITDFLLVGCRNFYKHGGEWAKLDLVLAVVLSGTTMLFARLSGSDTDMVPAFFVVYGLAVWVSGPLSRTEFVNNHGKYLWPALGVSFGLLAVFSGRGLITLGFSFLKDSIYWIILHKISAKLLHQIPLDVSNSSHAFRNLQMIGTLSVGEYLVGSMASHLSVLQECGWRAAVCILVYFVAGRRALDPKHA